MAVSHRPGAERPRGFGREGGLVGRPAGAGRGPDRDGHRSRGVPHGARHGCEVAVRHRRPGSSGRGRRAGSGAVAAGWHGAGRRRPLPRRPLRPTPLDPGRGEGGHRRARLEAGRVLPDPQPHPPGARVPHQVRPGDGGRSGDPPPRGRDQGGRRLRRRAPALLQGPARVLLPARPGHAGALRCPHALRRAQGGGATRWCGPTSVPLTSSSGATTPVWAATTAPTRLRICCCPWARKPSAWSRSRSSTASTAMPVGSAASAKTCPHDKSEHLHVSGTRQREMLSAGELPPPELTRPEVAVILQEAYAS